MDPGTNVGTHWCDNSDLSKYVSHQVLRSQMAKIDFSRSATFWLLNANYPKCKSCINADWQPFTTLKGGNSEMLDGDRWGISLEDVIASSYGGFLKNNKRNGYVSASHEGQIFKQSANPRISRFNPENRSLSMKTGTCKIMDGLCSAISKHQVYLTYKFEPDLYPKP
jgi:hypothetical protein